MSYLSAGYRNPQEQDPREIGPEDSCFNLPLDHIRELLAGLGDRPRDETPEDVNQRIQSVTRILESQEQRYLEENPACFAKG